MADFKTIDREVLVEELNKKFSQCVEAFEDNTNASIKVDKSKLVDVMGELKSNSQYGFTLLSCLTAVDYPENFTVVYQLISIDNKHKLTVKVEADKANPQVPSVVSVWKAANVQEREVYDLMGITFVGHPNLIRILCPDDFVGHPLRKDWKMEA